MQHRIETLPETKLIGMRMHMSLVDNKTSILWKNFMTNRKAIKNIAGSSLFSIQVYDSITYFTNFNPKNPFTKWATAEVDSFNDIPEGMEQFILKEGLYAVFNHIGPASDFPKTAQYIYSVWLPNSEYELDNRPHFELLGEKYKNNAPDSEEEVWIPIKSRS